MACLGEAFSGLHNQLMDFNTKCEYGKNEVQEKIFFSLHNCFNCWSESTVQNVKILDDTIITFVDYNKTELETIKDVFFSCFFIYMNKQLIKDRNLVCAEYYRSKYELNDKKKKKIDTEIPKLAISDRNLKILGITLEEAQANKCLLKRVILPEVFYHIFGFL